MGGAKRIVGGGERIVGGGEFSTPLGHSLTIAENYQLVTKIRLQKESNRHRCAQLQTIVHELQRVALSPHLDLPPNYSLTFYRGM